MLLALAICVFGQKGAVDVAAYFPLDRGAKWTYMREANGSRGQFVQVAGAEKQIGADRAIPIEPQIPGVMPAFYALKNGAVYVVAYDYLVPLVPPRMVFRASAATEKWSWDAVEHTMYIHMDAESAPVGIRKVLGEDRDVIQVKMVAQVSATNSKWTETQIALYAKGIGLYEMQDESSGEMKSKVTLTLTSFEPGRSAKSLGQQ